MTTMIPDSRSEGSAFSRFMASGKGRIARVALGGGLIATGALIIPGPTGNAVAVFGLVPIAAGDFNLCAIAPAWGGHFLGSRYCKTERPATESRSGTDWSSPFRTRALLAEAFAAPGLLLLPQPLQG